MNNIIIIYKDEKYKHNKNLIQTKGVGVIRAIEVITRKMNIDFIKYFKRYNKFNHFNVIFIVINIILNILK